jgi:cellulose synthase/poly-beta-1,6-N-acetylglucosamine synthase-like glycosyltransferase
MMQPYAAAWGVGLCLFIVAYTYCLYPALIAFWSRFRPRPVRRAAGHEPTVSVVLAVWNEAANLERRVANLLDQHYPPDKLEIVVVSDGSTDATGDVLRRLADGESRLRSLLLSDNAGKAVALNEGVAAASGELIVFADARQTFAPDAIARLAENFADPRVGSASGELELLDAPPDPSAEPAAGSGVGVAANVGLYWRYEKWIRRNESAAGSMLGATGAIYAIRRHLYRPLPPGALLDDFLTPMRIVLGGRRAIFDGRAVAADRVSTRAGQEFRRKVRTLAGNFQAVAAEPGLLFPWSNPATWWQLWSHKLLRLLVPWALLALLPATLLAGGPAMGLLAAGQILFYLLALAGWLAERRGRPLMLKPVGLAYTFVVLNLAAAVGLIAWLRDGSGRGVWRKAYRQGSP